MFKAQAPAPALVMSLAAVLAALVLVFDLSLPLGVAGGVPYVAVVLLGIWLPRARHVLALAALASVLTLAGYFFSPPGGIPWVVLSNRGLALFAIWVTALLVLQRQRAERDLRHNRDQLERKLRASTIQLRTVTDNLPALITHLDAGLRYLFVNREAERWYGRSAEDIIGRSAREILGEAAYVWLAPRLAEVLEGQTRRFTEHLTYPDGVTRDVDIVFVPDFGDDGAGGAGGAGAAGAAVKGVFGLAIDISQQRTFELELVKAREAAELANRVKSQFLANMSHELRTPLNAIMGFAEIMSLQTFGPLGDRHYEDYAADIHHSGEHLLSLINDILDIAKVESGDAELHETEVDIAAAIEESLRLVRGRAEKGGLKLVVEAAPGLPLLHADQRMVKQMLINLLSNAVKFTEPGGRITVNAAARTGGGLELAVSDTGIGIAADDIPRVLSAFGQVENTVNRRQEGTGLGLPLVRSLAELHGGGLDLSSEPGVGTRAAVWFPPERLNVGAIAG